MKLYHTNRMPAGINIHIFGTKESLTAIFLNAPEERIKEILSNYEIAERKDIHQAGRQLEEYFNRKRKAFELPLKPEGSDFRMRVWNALRSIPFGKTVSYGDLAGKLGGSSYSRAVGGAVGANPLPIVIPCHRVIRANGALGGFSAGDNPNDGLAIKKQLLALEQENCS